MSTAPSVTEALLLVALPGGIGAALRHLCDSAATRRWGEGQVRGIVAVNLLGALVAGLLVGATAADMLTRTVGIAALGGFTTFSTAMVHTLSLAADGDRAGLRQAVAHAVATALGSVLAAGVGLSLAGAALGG